MRVATWNINSVRLRLNQVLELISEKKLDVLCLQETKTQDEFFPSPDFAKIGMKSGYILDKAVFHLDFIWILKFV